MNGIWIHSQDRKTLVYAKRIAIERFKEHENNRYLYRIINQVLYQDNADDYDVLGVYTTEKRAMEILGDISRSIDGLINKSNKVFYMP
ncbi:MAG TPA: hypothetical protein GXX72_00165 [Clostridiaceae bacterium]|nr:hypothetical protein [Clostridiaceae bacterium]